MIPLDRPLRLTKHARRRFKERTGLPMRAVDTAAARALVEGVTARELPGFLRDKLAHAVARHSIDRDDPTVARVYRGFAFIFALRTDETSGDDAFVLLTVLPGYDYTKDAVEHMALSADTGEKLPRAPRAKVKARREFYKHKFRGGPEK